MPLLKGVFERFYPRGALANGDILRIGAKPRAENNDKYGRFYSHTNHEDIYFLAKFQLLFVNG